MRRSADVVLWRRVLGCGVLAALGCGDESGLAPAPVGSDVERDGWIDAPSLVSGDGATDFVSGPPSAVELYQYPQFQDPRDAAPGAAAVGGQRIYGLSSYAGLVITDASSPGPSRVEGRYPLDGMPFSIREAGGIVLALVNEHAAFVCLDSLYCHAGGEGHIVLIDARVPSAPRLLAERRVPGTISHAQQVGDTLYVVSRDFAPCGEGSDCIAVPEGDAAVTAIGLGDPLGLSDQGQLTLPAGDGLPTRYFLFDGARLFVATALEDVRILELDGLRLGPAAPLPGFIHVVFGGPRFTLDAGILRVQLWDSPAEVQYRVTPTELIPIEPIRYPDSDGDNVVGLVFQEGSAAGLGNGGRTLLTFDLSEREAPRQVGSVELPFAAYRLYATRDGELVALGSSDAGEPNQATRLALLDARAATAPALLDELTLSGEPEYDAASGLLLVSDGSRVRVVNTQGGELVLDSRVPVAGSPLPGGLVSDGDRVVDMRQNRLSTYPTGSGEPITLELTRFADAARWIGGQLVRFERGGSDARLLPPEPGDLLMADGPSLNDVVLPAAGIDRRGPLGGKWLPRALARDGRAYFASKPIAADGALGIYGVDVSDPGSPFPAGSAFVAPAADGDAYLDLIQTRNSMIVVRGQLGSFNYTPQDAGRLLYPRASLSFDVVDVSAPGAPRAAGSVELPAARASGVFGRWPTSATSDTAWGGESSSLSALLLVSGEVIASAHAEAVDARHRRFFVDRIDVTNPDAPGLLPPVNIPGQLIAFDAASGSLMSVETLRFEERGSFSDCERSGYASSYEYNAKPVCHVERRALNGLSLDGEVATRRSQLVLDDNRRSVAFAASGDRVYYVTEPLLSGNEVFAARSYPRDLPFSVERVRMDHGQLERLPSIDVTNLHDALPREWQLYARGDRLFTLSQNKLGVIDTGVDPPSVRTLPLPEYGCVAFEVAGNAAYCSRGSAGLVAIDLDAAQ